MKIHDQTICSQIQSTLSAGFQWIYKISIESQLHAAS